MTYSSFRLSSRPLKWSELPRLTQARLPLELGESFLVLFLFCSFAKIYVSLTCLPTLDQDLLLVGRGLGILERLVIAS